MNITHILVATDLSKDAENCIPSVADLARLVNARITLLHVAESLAAIPHGSPLAEPLQPVEHGSIMERARAQLEQRRASFGSDIVIDLKLVPGGDPAEQVVAYANANDVDLIAVTTHGRTGIKRLLLGSVAEGIIRHAAVPVLVLPLHKD